MPSVNQIRPFRLLHYASNGDTGGNCYRILVPGNMVKYITVDGGIVADEEKFSEAALTSLLPLPSNNKWKCLRVFQSTGNGELDYVVLSGEMPGIRNIWHPRTVEYVDLLAVDMSQSSNEMLRQPRSNVVAVKSPLFPVPVVAKFAVWPETIKDIDKESKGYLLVNSHNIGPKVLGHITEEGRVIGLVLERLDGHPATLEHLAACKEALGKLHDLGLQHGNLWCKSFVVKDGKATIVDFEEVRPLWDECRLALEMQDLEWALEAGDDLDDDDY